ncbi:hypothetical protein [Lentzea sp. NPDC055074]
MTTAGDATSNFRFRASGEHVVQAGAFYGDVYFSQSSDQRVVVTVVHHEKEVLFTELVRVLTVVIENRGNEEHFLSLKVVGLSDAILGTATVLLQPGRETRTTVTLRREKDAPEANRCRLQIQAFDVEDSSGRWASEIMFVVIPPQPKLRVRAESLLVGQDGEYEAALWLVNEGNVRLTGTITVLSAEEAETRVRSVVSPRLVDVPERFVVGAGEAERVVATVKVAGRTALSRRTHVLFRAEPDDASAEADTGRLEIRQRGRLHELTALFDVLAAFRAGTRTMKRGKVMDLAAASLLVGLLVGALLRGAPEAATTPTQAAMPSPSGSSAAPASTERGQPPPMPCVPGTVVVSLEAVFGPEGRDHVDDLVAYQAAYVARVAPAISAAHTVHYTDWALSCPNFRGVDHPEGVYYVWLGPMTAEQSAGICAALKKRDEDCRPIPIRG